MFFEGLFSSGKRDEEAANRLQKYLARVTIPRPDIKVIRNQSDPASHSYSFEIRGSVGPTVRRVHSLDEDGYPDAVLVQTFKPDTKEFQLDYTFVTFSREGVDYQLYPYSFRIANSPLHYHFRPRPALTEEQVANLFTLRANFDDRGSNFVPINYSNIGDSFELLPGWRDGQSDFILKALSRSDEPYKREERIEGSYKTDYPLFQGSASTKVVVTELPDGSEGLDWTVKQNPFSVNFIKEVSRIEINRPPFYTNRIFEIINAAPTDWYRETDNLPVGISQFPELSSP